MLNIDKLLAPVGADRPCGEDLAFSSEIDAIARARQADDPSLQQGAWVTELKEADWKFVAKQCAQLIEVRSKDLQLAVWLAEAAAKTAGLRGLGEGLDLVAALCEQYWDGLYPLPDEGGFEQRIGILAWVAGRIGPWLREIPLVEGADAHALRDVEAARTRGPEHLARLEAARQRTPRGVHEATVRDGGYCLEAIERLERSADARLGADGPSFSAARSVLESVLMLVQPLAGNAPGAAAAQDRQAGAAAAAAQGNPAPGVPAVEQGAGRTAAPGGPPQDRMQALAQLRGVAEFFRRTEPHSPVAYLAEKAAHWGEQPLHVWLRSVIKDDASFAHIEEMLGVHPPPAA
ncbi:type VI secretion system protein TssA [Massilia forsythiae]|uniref:Type VI secretion system protein TssA n=1 Tax=Massilia forsythiae TaxID=2728020 RepID=A0A7Z2W0K7_9BURK|nr:type VI secretion system protein TssA [Massilia forsythiae]QJE02852.1 type VI secretion system protein TssA [Massilia forsythiae]